MYNLVTKFTYDWLYMVCRSSATLFTYAFCPRLNSTLTLRSSTNSRLFSIIVKNKHLICDIICLFLKMQKRKCI